MPTVSVLPAFLAEGGSVAGADLRLAFGTACSSFDGRMCLGTLLLTYGLVTGSPSLAHDSYTMVRISTAHSPNSGGPASPRRLSPRLVSIAGH